ncbi:hypothetical protein ACNJYA_13045 [Bradyrhizobium sp. DASA03068]|uniref:hypothetical protein n=1 Tax=Bradyrhizobium sp. BLXBL-01 TaxID=3395915 RepID=UPI003F704FC3
MMRFLSRISPATTVLALALFNIIVLLVMATRHLAYLQNDPLAPFYLIDQAYHGELLIADRQPWLLPLLIGKALHGLSVADRYTLIMHASTAITTIFVGLTALPLFFLVRRFGSDRTAMIAVILLLANAQFCISGLYLNPTALLTFLLTLFFAVLVYWPPRAPLTLATIAGFSVLIRHEGLILAAFLLWIIYWKYRHDHSGRPAALKAVAFLALIVVANYTVRLLWTADAIGFLRNTGTSDKFFSLLSFSPARVFSYLMAVLNYKMEKLDVIAATLPLPLLALVPIGAVASLGKRSGAGFIMMYLPLYEAVVLIYLLVLPVSTYLLQNYSAANLLIDVRNVARYYQVFTPMLLFFAAIGGAEAYHLISSKTSGKFDAQLVKAAYVIVAVFCINQQFLLQTSYRFQFVNAEPHAAEAFETADWFRARQIRRTPIGMIAPSLHPVHFAIMSGNNEVNCWGGQSDPNWNCEQAGRASATNLLQAGDQYFSYALIETSSPLTLPASSYTAVFTSSGGRYTILQNIRPAGATPH